MVNSVHGQGIDRLAQGLRVEAVADDGLVEAVSVIDAQQFALAVQWHPEWKVRNNAFYLAIFEAFGNACRGQAQRR
jgi:putative glutamine amidotransferase